MLQKIRILSPLVRSTSPQLRIQQLSEPHTEIELLSLKTAPQLSSIYVSLLPATSQLTCQQCRILCNFPNVLYQTFAKPLYRLFFKSPRSGIRLSRILRNVARRSPQMLPHLLLRLHVNLMSVVLLPAPYCVRLCSQAPRVLLTLQCTLPSGQDLAFGHCPGNLKLRYLLISYCKYRLDLKTENLLYIILPLIRETQDI